MRDHARLKVFQLADRLAVAVYRSTAGFPAHEQFGLTTQLRRAAVSAASNIVEGAARRSSAEFCRFLLIAYSSAQEVGYQLSLAKRLGYLPTKPAAELADLASQTGRALRALIAKVSQDSGRSPSG